MSEAARSRRDDARYEPQIDAPRRDVAQAANDPLAELARLVGQDDPFRGVFRPAGDPRAERAPRPERDIPQAGAGLPPTYAGWQEHDDGHGGAQAADGAWHPEHGHHDHHGQADLAQGGYARHDGERHDDAAYDSAAYDDAHHGHGPHDGAVDGHGHAYHGEQAYHGEHAEHGYDEHYDERYYAVDQAAHVGEAGLADAPFAADAAADAAAAATLPDMWARGAEAADGRAPAVGAADGHPGLDGRRSSARRPLAVLAAVLVLTGGGLAASFLVKGSSTSSVASASAGRGAPTIMAAAGPTKVKVEDAGATAPEDQDAALLNKGNASSGPVRIVSSQEQPADLNQLPRSSDLADGARPLPPAAPSPFPEPKRVKTFVVHPDGTMLSADGVPAASAEPVGVPSAATPRTANRGATTPSAAATPAAKPAATASAAPTDAIAALTATPADAPATTPARSARQPASPGVRTASAKPNDAADAPSTSGGFGVQLASSPVEADANAAFAKLKRKYPAQLGSLTATVHRAETGDKPVYRVRVGSMSQDEAKTLCSQLQGAGGSCFVVHN